MRIPQVGFETLCTVDRDRCRLHTVVCLENIPTPCEPHNQPDSLDLRGLRKMELDPFSYPVLLFIFTPRRLDIPIGQVGDPIATRLLMWLRTGSLDRELGFGRLLSRRLVGERVRWRKQYEQ